VLEDYRRLIKTHEFCTLKTTGVEHAYRRLRMRVLITCLIGELSQASETLAPHVTG
jgi:hypothetical protein